MLVTKNMLVNHTFSPYLKRNIISMEKFLSQWFDCEDWSLLEPTITNDFLEIIFTELRQKEEYEKFEACIKMVGYIIYASESESTTISQMFELGLADVLMDTLSMTEIESLILIKKTLWAIANILHDSKESYRKITVDNGGEILQRCIDLLFSLNDP